ncbi:MAG: 16S rRNA (cytidine(1402)-2'-O)-methyltransferase [Bacteroidota bacterium]
MKHGILYLVAVPIGNEEDISHRAAAVLGSVDLVAMEEAKEGTRLLRRLGIRARLTTLNEHNEPEASRELLGELTSGHNVALISDGGTPVFADPGRLLVSQAAEAGIRIVPVPGPSSLMAALVVTGFRMDRFLFYGWLSPKADVRRRELRTLRREPMPIVILETPYRLLPLMRDLAESFGGGRRICLAFNLTLPDERIFRGTAEELHREMEKLRPKGEFVVVLEGMAGPPLGRPHLRAPRR